MPMGVATGIGVGIGWGTPVLTAEPTNPVLDEPSVQLWLDSVAIADPDETEIATWEDSSSHGNDATQPTEGFRPTYYATPAPTVAFDGSGDYMILAGDPAGLELDGDFTLMAVVSLILGTAQYILSKDAGAASAGACAWQITDTGRSQIDRPYIEAGTPATAAIADSTPTLVVVRVSGTTVTHRKNGAANGTSALPTGTATNVPLKIGCTSVGATLQYFLSGELPALVVCNAALSDETIEDIEAFLMDRHGVTA